MSERNKDQGSVTRTELKKCRVGNLSIAYQDQGTGVPVLMVHCSSASHREWSFVADKISESRRVIAPDLIAYGKSDAWPGDEPMPHDADVVVLESLLKRLDEPVDLIGHSYGGAMCLELARRHALQGGKMIRSMHLIEPVSFNVLKSHQPDKSWRIISRVASNCVRYADSGQLRKAADVYMGFWLGSLRWHLSPRKFKGSVLRTIGKVADEFRGLYNNKLTASDYSSIRCPVTLLRGAKTQLPARTVVDVLAAALPNVTVVDIPGAGHMSPFTHKEPIQDLLLAGIAH